MLEEFLDSLRSEGKVRIISAPEATPVGVTNVISWLDAELFFTVDWESDKEVREPAKTTLVGKTAGNRRDNKIIKPNIFIVFLFSIISPLL